MRRRYPIGIETGTAVSIGAYDLPARWVIHAVGPVWNQGGQDRLDLLASAFAYAFRDADELGAWTITMPAISAGTFHFPIDAAADVALRTVIAHLERQTGIEQGTSLDSFRRRLATI